MPKSTDATTQILQYTINVGTGNQTATMTNNPNGSLKTLSVSDTFYANEDETCQYLYDSDFRLLTRPSGLPDLCRELCL